MTAARRPSLALVLGLAAATLIGAFLRLVRLSPQVLIGDELHPVNAALERSVGEILRSWVYYGADYCVPLTALYRLAMDAGIRLSETDLRAPILCAGLLALLVMPLALRRRLGARATVVFAFLLALSPLLALYSRILRSYMPATLAAFVAVACFEWWLRTGRRAAAAGYGVCAALAIWLNLTTLPLAAAPVVYAALRIVLAWRERRSELVPLVRIGAFAALCVAALLLPAAESLLALRAIHGRGALPTAETWWEVARMHAGTRSAVVALLLLAALARGAVVTWRRDRELLVYGGSLAALHVLGLAALGPSQLDNPIVMNRYLLVLLPFGLALTAVGLAAPLARVPATAQAAGIAALLAAQLATGPFAGEAFRRTSFVHGPTFIYFVRDGNWLPPDQVPRFYREAAQGGQRPIIEYPWFNLASHALDAYQKVHGRPIRVATPSLQLQDPRLDLKIVLRPAAADYLASDARWLVVHLDLKAEERRVNTSDRNHWIRLERRPELWDPLERAGTESARVLTQGWGAPEYAEDGLRVWDLDRVRRQQQRR